MQPALTELRERLAEIDDLSRAQNVLSWDHDVWMPPRGGASRATQLGTLEAVIHGKQIDARIGELLDELAPYAADLPPDDLD